MPRRHVTTNRGLDRRLLLVCAALALLSAACGGSSSNGSSSNPPSNTPPTDTPVSTEPVNVNGTERLGWTQVASSLSTLRAFTFFVYVDGSRSPLADARCGSNAGASGFDCSAALPKMTGGKHVIELATVGGGGFESARSAKLTVMMVGSGTAAAVETVDAAPPAPLLTASAPAIPSCGNAAWQCATIPSPAAGLGLITALESLPDGRVLAVESGTRILVQQADTWSVGYAVANDPRAPTHIASIARDRAFDSTHFVYVAEVATAEDGTRTARVLRTREVANQLGEPSTIVAGEVLVPSGDPVVAVGSDGLVYLALPGDPTAADPATRQGRLLRFTADGSAAGTAATGSATLTEIAPGPRSLAWDPQGRLWIAASGDTSTSGVARVDAAAAARWTRQPITLLPAPQDGDTEVQSLVFSGSASSTGAVPVYLVADSPAVLYRGVMDSTVRRDALTSLASLPLGGWEPTAIAVGADGNLVVAARQNTGAGEVRSVLRLTLSQIIPIHN